MTATETALDVTRVEQCAQRVFGAYVDSMLVLMIDLADRTGLLDALTEGPGTSGEVAERAGITERYARECLGALVTGGLVDYDPATARYDLPPEHAVCLTGGGAADLAPLSRIPTLLAHYVDEVATVTREGGGVPYERFRPAFTTVMDGVSRGVFDQHLVDAIVPVAPDLQAGLERGIRVADIGCGTGHSTVVLAEAFPASTFVGYDLADDALESGRAEARAAGLDNVTFEQLDVARAARRSALRRGGGLRRHPRPGRPGRRARPRPPRPDTRRGVPHDGHQGFQPPRAQRRQSLRALPVRGQHAALHDGLAGPRRRRARHGLG
jgi:hypothetical protein